MKLLKVFTQPGLFTDLVILAGLSMLFYGLFLQWPWLAFTVTGSILIILGVVMVIR